VGLERACLPLIHSQHTMSGIAWNWQAVFLGSCLLLCKEYIFNAIFTLACPGPKLQLLLLGENYISQSNLSTPRGAPASEGDPCRGHYEEQHTSCNWHRICEQTVPNILPDDCQLLLSIALEPLPLGREVMKHLPVAYIVCLPKKNSALCVALQDSPALA
jgi:hypothetical protein